MIDYNAYVGDWPFYKLPRTTLGELAELHRKNGISGGYISSLQSIFLAPVSAFFQRNPIFAIRI